MRPFILPLNSPEATLRDAGGKGVNLARMARAGIPAPPGFIITTTAYRTFVSVNELEKRIEEFNLSGYTNDLAALENASQSIRNLFQAAPMPPDMAEDIIERYRHLNLQAVAVRSSATAEDLPGFSFAGLQDTYLNVQGEEALLDAVKRCWSSLWNARAIAYRWHHGIDQTALSQAVVVQHMVRAERAGVLFTVNPQTGDPDEVVINAVWGLGESVVSGRVTPDNIIVEKASGKVKRMDIADKESMTVPVDCGIQEMPVDPKRRRQAVLCRGQAAGLTRLGEMVEMLFGVPQDVEWAIDGRDVHILQARPVTIGAIPTNATPVELSPPGNDDWPTLGKWSSQPFDRWTRANVGELWREPVSPIVASTVPMIISGAVSHSFRGINAGMLDKIQWARRFYGRIYYNEGALRHLISKELGLPAAIMDRTRGNRSAGSSPGESRLHPFKILRHLPVLRRLAARQWSTGRALDMLIPQIDRWLDEFLQRNDFDSQTDCELWDEALLWFERLTHALKLQNDMSGYSQTAMAMLDNLMFRWFGRHDLALDLVTGLPGIQAAEMGAALWQMAQKISDLGLTKIILDNDPQTALSELRQAGGAAPVMEMLNTFLKNHGFRCPNEAEWLHPRWLDEPAQVMELIAGYLRPGHLLEFKDEGTERREKATAWVNEHTGPWRRRVFSFVLRRTQHAVRLRDNGKSHAIKASYPARKLVAQFGKRWTDRGWLSRPEDIFFLTVPDIQKIIDAGDPGKGKTGLDLRELVAERRRVLAFWYTIEAPDELGPDGKPTVVPAAKEGSTPILKGIPAGSGRVQGVARIIHDPLMALKMKPGEILVTRVTDAGWSAVFPLIAGLVTEIGGQLSHAAILAREYGLPVIVNVQNATRQLYDGQVITIDCADGCIYLEE